MKRLEYYLSSATLIFAILLNISIVMMLIMMNTGLTDFQKADVVKFTSSKLTDSQAITVWYMWEPRKQFSQADYFYFYMRGWLK